MSASPKVRVMERVGRQLQEEYGDRPIPAGILSQRVAEEGGWAVTGVFPSVHCYNRTNYPIAQDYTPMFVHEEGGRYRFVGTAHPFTGPLFCYPKDGPPMQIGAWVEGELTRRHPPKPYPPEGGDPGADKKKPAPPTGPVKSNNYLRGIKNHLPTAKVALEILAAAVTVIGFIIALIWGSK